MRHTLWIFHVLFLATAVAAPLDPWHGARQSAQRAESRGFDAVAARHLGEALALAGPDRARRATSEHELGVHHLEHHAGPLARTHLRAAVALREAFPGAELELAETESALARCELIEWADGGSDPARAERHARRAFQLRLPRLRDDTRLAGDCESLAAALAALKRPAEALEFATRAVVIRERDAARQPVELRRALHTRIQLELELKRHDAARTHLARLSRLPEPPDYWWMFWYEEAKFHRAAGDSDTAARILERVIDYHEVPPDVAFNPELEAARAELHGLYLSRADFRALELRTARSIGARRRTNGWEPEGADDRVPLLLLYQLARGKYADATRAALDRSAYLLDTCLLDNIESRPTKQWLLELVHGRTSGQVARALEREADACLSDGPESPRFAQAEALYRSALEIWERVAGPASLSVSLVLERLAVVCEIRKDDEGAATLLERVLAIHASLQPGDHDDARLCLRLAEIHERLGRTSDARRAGVKGARGLFGGRLADSNSAQAGTLHEKSVLLRRYGEPAEADAYRDRALEILEAENEPEEYLGLLADVLADKAAAVRSAGRDADAARMEARASQLREKAAALAPKDTGAPRCRNAIAR